MAVFPLADRATVAPLAVHQLRTASPCCTAVKVVPSGCLSWRGVGSTGAPRTSRGGPPPGVSEPVACDAARSQPPCSPPGAAPPGTAAPRPGRRTQRRGQGQGCPDRESAQADPSTSQPRPSPHYARKDLLAKAPCTHSLSPGPPVRIGFGEVPAKITPPGGAPRSGQLRLAGQVRGGRRAVRPSTGCASAGARRCRHALRRPGHDVRRADRDALVAPGHRYSPRTTHR